MLSAWCDDLLALPEEVWSAYALSREPLRGRLDREGYRPYYDRAAACGGSACPGQRRCAFCPPPP